MYTFFDHGRHSCLEKNEVHFRVIMKYIMTSVLCWPLTKGSHRF